MSEERLELMARAEQIVAEAAASEGMVLHPFMQEGLVVAVKLHGLTQPGVYRLVEELANVERESGRLAPKPAPDWSIR